MKKNTKKKKKETLPSAGALVFSTPCANFSFASSVPDGIGGKSNSVLGSKRPDVFLTFILLVLL